MQQIRVLVFAMQLIEYWCLPCNIFGYWCLPCNIFGYWCLPCNIFEYWCLPCNIIWSIGVCHATYGVLVFAMQHNQVLVFAKLNFCLNIKDVYNLYKL